MARALIAVLSDWQVLRAGVGLLALPGALGAAWALWQGGRTSTAVALALSGAVLGARYLPLGYARDVVFALVIVALPTLGVLQRYSPDVMGEAAMAGAGPIRRALVVLPRLAAGGLIFGYGLWLLAPQLGLAQAVILGVLLGTLGSARR